MCMQCAMGAMAAGTAATGMRAWLVALAPAWLTPRRKRALSATLVGGAVVASAVLVG